MPTSSSDAYTLYQNGAYYEALIAFKQLLREQPISLANLVSCANCYDKLGRKKGAIKLYKRAISKFPTNVTSYVNLSLCLYEEGHFTESEKYCRLAIGLDSGNISSWINLGNIQYQRREYDTALRSYLTADSLQSNNYLSKINIANTYYELKDYPQTLNYARQALDIDDNSVMGWSLLGNANLELDNYELSLDALGRAIKLNSQDAWLYNSLSQVFQKKGAWEDALKAGLKSISLSKEPDAQHINFGYMLYECSMENPQMANNYAKIWLDSYADNQIVKHMGTAIKNGEKLERANDEYIKNIFDIFASDFESVLSSLDYQAPQLIFNLMKEIYGEQPKTKLHILDAGCGTGLCGNFLHRYSSKRGLEGVDLSAKMLEQAKAKKIYAKLHNVEMIKFLSQYHNRYDLIVSSDVFTYIGNLQPLFANLHQSLKQYGRLIFTISENEQDKDDYMLHSSGRFLHGENYIKKQLAEYGFEIEFFERKRLRNEGDNAVYGFVVSALKR